LLADSLSKLDNEIFLIGSNKSFNGRKLENKKIKKLPFITASLDFPLNKKFYFLQNLVRTVAYPIALLKIYLIIKKNKIDVVHFQWSNIPILETIFIFFVKNQTKVFYTAHNTTLFHGEKKRIHQLFNLGREKFLRSLNKIIVHTEYSKKVLVNLYPHLVKKIDIVPYGQEYFLSREEKDNNSNKETVLNSNETSILFFGQISFYKGIDILLEAVKVMQEKNFVIQIYGRPEIDINQFLNYSKINGISDKVKWNLSYLSNFELDEALKSSDILVFPYRHIDQSSALMSSLIYGKPIVASKIGGFKEILKDKVNGYLFEKENFKELALKLDSLISSKTDREKFGLNNYELSKNWPSWLEISKITLDIYNS
tara:strand:- start:1850 stop:2956 length:1107 start_codon:yes stop_codon:yes gene_type:complete